MQMHEVQQAGTTNHHGQHTNIYNHCAAGPYTTQETTRSRRQGSNKAIQSRKGVVYQKKEKYKFLNT